jgi:tetratricopeptide (TPR) repeat protein
LLASETPADRLGHAKQAVALLYPLLPQHPDHPGLAHYIIHACDNPQLAEKGVEAARRYAQIAPSAPHALHMPSHIFARRGLWADDIRSNLASKAAAEDTTGAHIGGENRLHAMEFLEYAYLQSGQYEEARAIATEAQTVKSADVSYPDYYLTVEARFPALLAIETQDWTLAANLQPVPNAHWFSHAQTLLANAIAAGHQPDDLPRRKASETYDALATKALPAGTPPAHLRDEIRAWAAFSAGDSKSALDLLRPVAERQATVGKGEVELPAREMLAEMLLLEGNPREALEEYERSLQTDPNRFNGLLGAAKAAEQLGDGRKAAEYYRQVLTNCPSANGAAVSVLAHARAVAGL